MTVIRRRTARVITRDEAAQMIRAARSAPRGSDERGELIGWAKTVMRDNRLVRRLKIDHLLDVGEFDSADGLIARALMRGGSRESNWAMRVRYARSLHAQGRLDEGWKQINAALEARPNSVAALQLAAAIAGGVKDYSKSVELLRRAVALKPRHAHLRCLLVEALLSTEQIREASELIETMPDALPVLRARVRTAEGRLLEAVELLERALHLEFKSAERVEITLDLTALLETMGDEARLIRAGADHEDARVRLRVAHAMLRQGEFKSALAAVQPLRAQPRTRRAALPVAFAALAMVDESDEARTALIEWRTLEPRPDRRAVAATWLNALCGRTLANVIDARSSGRDPSVDILGPMLEQAAATLSAPPASRGIASLDVASLHNLRDLCLRELGRTPPPAAKGLRTSHPKSSQISSTVSRLAA